MTRARLVLVPLLGVLLSCTPNSDPQTSAGEPPTYPRVEGLDSGCPSREQEPNLPEGPLPAGATTVRLCNVEGDRYFFGRNKQVEDDYDLPPDALATGVSELVEIVNSQSARDTEDQFCGGVGSATMVLWFSYPDADYAVTYNPGGCGSLDRGDGVITGANEVHRVFSDLLWQQRASAAAPDLHERPKCQPTSQDPTPMLLSEHMEIDEAVWCAWTRTPDARLRPARLSPGQVAQLNEAFTTEESDSVGPCRGRPQLFGALNVVTAWGDQATFPAACQNLFVPVPFGEPERIWPLSEEARTLLASLRPGRSIKNVPYDPDQIRLID